MGHNVVCFARRGKGVSGESKFTYRKGIARRWWVSSRREEVVGRRRKGGVGCVGPKKGDQEKPGK